MFVQLIQIYCVFTVEFQTKINQTTNSMKNVILPTPNAKQIALKRAINKEKKAGRYIIIRDHAHEMEIFEEMRLQKAISGAKKKK